MGEQVAASLDAESPAYVFPEGKRFFTAFSLPEGTAPLQITIVSPSAGEGILKPMMVLLDARFEVTRSVGMQEDRDWEAKRYHKTIFTNPDDERERYMVVYAEVSDGEVAGSQLIRTPIIVGDGVFLPMIAVGHHASNTAYVFSPTGRLRIEVQPYQPGSADKEEESAQSDAEYLELSRAQWYDVPVEVDAQVGV